MRTKRNGCALRRRMALWLAVMAGIVPGVTWAGNSVFVSSKTVDCGAKNKQVDIFVQNDASICGLVLPLEFRSVAGGAYIAGSCTLNYPATNRIGASPLTGSVTKRIMGNPAAQTCSGPVSSTYYTNSPVDFISPDGFLWFGISTNPEGSGLWYLPPGSDSIAGVFYDWPAWGQSTPYAAGASFNFVFDVADRSGFFEIDTCCVSPANHLSGTDLNTELVEFAFTKSVVAVGMGSPDADGDGVADVCDNCPTIYNPGQEDLDSDRIGDVCDSCMDTDHDGFGNPGFPQNACPQDNCPTLANPGQEDTDGDGIGDVCDLCTDTDGDGFGNPGFPANTCPPDNCPLIYNAGQEDADGDGVGDVCDNCPSVYNPGQENRDGDAFGDSCDACTDTDGDGYGNPGFPKNTCPVDNCPTVANAQQTDSDGDGVGDACDNCMNIPNPGQQNADGDAFGDTCDPCPYDPGNDADGDGLCANVDNCPTVFNPGQADADHDGRGDACDDCTPCANRVVVESKTVSWGARDVKVDVVVENNVELNSLTLPLMIRSVTPGAYITRSCTFNCPSTHRIGASPLIGFATMKRFFPRTVSAEAACYDSTRTFRNAAPYGVDFISPDGLIWAGFAMSSPPQLAYLPPGTDSVAGVFNDWPEEGQSTPYVAGASFNFVIDVTDRTGTFEIDTCCVTPANHLYGTAHPSIELVPFSFTKGVITITGPLSFYGAPLAGDPPLTVFFHEGLPDEINFWNSWEWSFGDGSTASVPNPIHTYTDTGSFTVSLKTTAGADSFRVTYPNYIHVIGIHADFAASPRGGKVPLDVSFADLSTGNPTAWSWNFGDGGTSTLQNPTHQYTSTGWFDVTLVASKPSGTDTRKYLRYIHVADTVTPDLAVTTYSDTPPRRGFDKCYDVWLTNAGTGTASGGTVRLVMPSQTMYVSSTQPSTHLGDTVSWTYTTLVPAAPPQKYRVCVNVPLSVSAGTWLGTTASVDPAAGEIVLVNNVDVDSEAVVAAIDPNDKLVQTPGCGPHGNVIQGSDPITYTILFENKKEATASAIYVLIIDTLDSRLDWGTLQIGPTIKDNVLTFDFDPFTGEMMWFFNGIDLPPNVNPPEGEGFVSYTISPKPGLAEGTVIPNRAHIRFDYEDWLTAPPSGSLDLTVMSCPDCNCQCHADPQCDGVATVQDVVKVIDEAFRGSPPIVDLACPHDSRSDLNCDDVVSIIDVVRMVNVAFRGANPATEFCDPCAP